MIRLPAFSLLATLVVGPVTAHAGVLVSSTFALEGRPTLRAYGDALTPSAVHAEYRALGTIDVARGQPGDSAVLTADFGAAPLRARAGLAIEPLAVRTQTRDLALLSLGFDLWVSEIRPVAVFIYSINNKGVVTGRLRASVNPPVSGAYYRFNVDLNQTELVEGKFDPRAPQVGFSFEIDDTRGSAPISRARPAELRVDNISYTEPSFYVSAKGRDSANGRNPRSAFATIGKAIAAAKAGDVILLMDAGGTFRVRPGASVASPITKAGAPDQWIVIRNHPGQKPHIFSDGWEVFKFINGSAYWEIRGLSMQGNRANVTIEDALVDGTIRRRPDGRNYPGDPKFNGNCITIEGRGNADPATRPHHFRVINNHVYEFGGGGITGMGIDYFTVENNLVHDNAHTMKYAGSGISLLHTADFDGNTGYKCYVIGNTVYNNRCYVPWARNRNRPDGTPIPNTISDGNGIIIDDNVDFRNYVNKPGIPYIGRTLLQNNLAYNNGGSGLHTFASNHVDFINNTAYHNAQSPELRWNQMFAGPRSSDVHFINNITWAPRGQPVDSNPGDEAKNIRFINNIFFGDGDNNVRAGGGLGGEIESSRPASKGNKFVNPGFVNPSVDPKVANFRLRPDSPAIDTGATVPAHAVPTIDIEGNRRPSGNAPDIGTYEFGAPR